jgi:hypothetical protein
MPVYSPYRETRRVVLTDAAQSIANATASDVTWGTEVTDPRGWTSGGSATLTCPTGDEGAYSVSFVGGWATNPTICEPVGGADKRRLHGRRHLHVATFRQRH